MIELSKGNDKAGMEYIKWVFFSLDGRLNRKPYWLAALAISVMCGVLQGILISVLGNTGVYISMGITVLLVIPCMIAAVKRCHDRGRKAWFLLLVLVPLLNIWVGIELAFLRGTVGENAYGADPLA